MVGEGVGGSLLVDVAGLSLRELDELEASAMACTLREVLHPDNAEVEVMSAFDNKM
ncbi:FXSXX-COOH protein [Nocardiopsis aegyptia]|uniref:FXSXX-COOH protein n=1 Tax=Nocardiopsis aegyptia TaxID=220378 RepID=A0A7Z0JD09_9ACTN|nr:FXSXX-COOH protein [Nocardiopsis aegyptia]NYJ37831.1 FXSXX-COOH protein [Nocardiopsis aegyptia]